MLLFINVAKIKTGIKGSYKMALRVGSLFSGIGGMELGLEKSGMQIIWQVEQDANCQNVLKKHWSNTNLYSDVKEVGNGNLKAVDLICGGFPCQDVSTAGKRAGLEGKRSGLWFEFKRIIDEMSPEWIVIENVPGLLSSNKGKDLELILSSLNNSVYYVDINILDTQNFGIPQRRRRLFILCHKIESILNTKSILSIQIILQCLIEILVTILVEAREQSSIKFTNSDFKRAYTVDGLIQKMNLFGITDLKSWNGFLKNLEDILLLYPKELSLLESLSEATQKEESKVTDTKVLGHREKENEENTLLISKLWSDIWEEVYAEKNSSIISTALKQTTESKIYTCAKIALITAQFINQSRLLSENSSSLELLSLTGKKVYTNYARQASNSVFTEHEYILLYNTIISQSERMDSISSVGSLGNLRSAQVLFDTESLSRNNQESGTDRKDDSAGSVQADSGDGEQRQAVVAFQRSQLRTNNAMVMLDKAPTLKAYTKSGDTETTVWQMNHASEVYRGAWTAQNRLETYQKEVSPTLQARMGTGGNNVPLIGIRRLTPVECARLQGFPDDWNQYGADGKVIPDTHRYRQYGNAVTVNVAEWLGKRIVKADENWHLTN